MSNTVNVSYKDTYAFDCAFANWRRITGWPYNENSRRQFRKFLGVSEDATWQDLFDNPQAYERLHWMAGPDAALKYRIWRAQNQS